MIREKPVKFEVLGRTRCAVGESPFWDANNEVLYWVDIPAKQLHSLEKKTGNQRVLTLPELVAAAALNTLGGLILVLERRVIIFDPRSDVLETLCTIEDDAGNRANDSRVDASGHLWVGTMQNNIAPDGQGLPVTRSSGSLYRIGLDGCITCAYTKLGIPNSLAWSPDNRTMYVADTLENAMFAFHFDLERGLLTERRRFPDRAPGFPDGSCVDHSGFIWNARWGGSCLARFSPEGRLERVVELPVTNPTSCTFDGSDNNTLYVTSATHGLDANALAANPLEGALLAVDVGVSGPAARAFGG